MNHRTCALAACVALVATSAPESPALTAMEHLRAAPAPVFRPAHTLLPLSRWGWSMPLDVRIELCERWGYALEFGGYVTDKAIDELEQKPDSANARVVALAASNPTNYPLFVLTHRPLGQLTTPPFPKDLLQQLYVRGAGRQPIVDDTTPARPLTNSWRMVSPEAPDAIFKIAAEGTVAPLLRLRRKAPIAVILNGGEYGLSVYGHSGRFWAQDPRVVAAKGERSWHDYLSERKAHQELIVSEAVRKAFPDRRLYLWYHFAGQPSWDPWTWSLDYRHMRPVSDLPDQSLYYREFNSGWTNRNDLLTRFLCTLTQAKERHGDALSYNWVAGGWLKGQISEPRLYMGFLKCLYTGGMIGGVAGYFSPPQFQPGVDVGAEPPPWLSQMMALGHVQALFSHVEDFIRDGDLLPGPLMHTNPNATNLPAYEFPTGSPDARVLVRKHRRERAWLATAWAADGRERTVSVDVPELGALELRARPEGAVYLVRVSDQVPHEPPKLSIVPLDPDGMAPSRAVPAR